eukprot:scaffold140_cov565-Prasinococcus_capsulatus_cf.AAC.25
MNVSRASFRTAWGAKLRSDGGERASSEFCSVAVVRRADSNGMEAMDVMCGPMKRPSKKPTPMNARQRKASAWSFRSAGASMTAHTIPPSPKHRVQWSAGSSSGGLSMSA